MIKTCQLHSKLLHPTAPPTKTSNVETERAPAHKPRSNPLSFSFSLITAGPSGRKLLRESPLPGSDLHIYGHAMTGGPRHHGECLFRAWMRRLKEVYTHRGESARGQECMCVSGGWGGVGGEGVDTLLLQPVSKRPRPRRERTLGTPLWRPSCSQAALLTRFMGPNSEAIWRQRGGL